MYCIVRLRKELMSYLCTLFFNHQYGRNGIHICIIGTVLYCMTNKKTRPLGVRHLKYCIKKKTFSSRLRKLLNLCPTHNRTVVRENDHDLDDLKPVIWCGTDEEIFFNVILKELTSHIYQQFYHNTERDYLL